MVVGAMNFPVYLGKLPDNVTFTITEIKEVKPSEGDWYTHTVC